jgi:hypothetical protein
MVKFMSRLLEKIYVGFETGSGSGSGKNNFGSTTLADGKRFK